MTAQDQKIQIEKKESLKPTAEINKAIARDVHALYSDHFKRKEKREAEKARLLAAEEEKLQREISRIFPHRKPVSQNVSRVSTGSRFSAKENSLCQETAPVVGRLLAAKELKDRKIQNLKKLN